MRRKTKKMRGSKTCGYGSKKKHRGKGHKGGHGFAGGCKHKHLEWRFGRHGFTRHGVKRIKKTINVEELNQFEGEVNLIELGYDKLLGSGFINKPLKVIVKEATEKAIEKIAAAGGEVVVRGNGGEE